MSGGTRRGRWLSCKQGGRSFALAAIALAGLKTRHYNLRRGTRRVQTADVRLDFWDASRRRGALLNENSIAEWWLLCR